METQFSLRSDADKDSVRFTLIYMAVFDIKINGGVGYNEPAVDKMTKYYLEHMIVGKHYGPYLCLKQEIHTKIGEILKLHRISELMPPTAFFYLNSYRNDK